MPLLPLLIRSAVQHICVAAVEERVVVVARRGQQQRDVIAPVVLRKGQRRAASLHKTRGRGRGAGGKPMATGV